MQRSHTAAHSALGPPRRCSITDAGHRSWAAAGPHLLSSLSRQRVVLNSNSRAAIVPDPSLGPVRVVVVCDGSCIPSTVQEQPQWGCRCTCGVGIGSGECVGTAHHGSECTVEDHCLEVRCVHIPVRCSAVLYSAPRVGRGSFETACCV